MASPGLDQTNGNPTDRPDTGGVGAVGVAAAALGACFLALGVTLVAGGALTTSVISEEFDPGPVTRWGLPAARQVMNLAGAATVGLLLMAVFFLPMRERRLGAQSLQYVRAASWSALTWAAAAGATLVLQLSDVMGTPPAAVLGDQLTSYAGATDQGIALVLVILGAIGLALLARTTESPGGLAGLFLLSLAALLPPPLTGHSASSPMHELAVSGVAMHVIAVSLWVGGLAVLVAHALRPDAEHLPTAAERFSRMALWAYIGVGLSGVASAASRLYTPAELVNNPYGLVILLKALLFVLVGFLGWQHRRRTVPGVLAGRRGAFARLAAVEIVILFAVMGLSVALSRTAPPPPGWSLDDPARAVLGFPMPPEISAANLLTLWRPDLFFALVVLVLGGLYAAGVVRLYRRGDPWPWGRTAAWFLGLLTIAAMKLTGVATYSMVLFSVHMTQHMVLSMLTPILLVLGAPATLALRALKPARQRGDLGPREWLTLALHSKIAAFLTHPAFVVPIFVGSTYALYFSPLFGRLMSDHLGHMAMSVHFLLVGYLFYWIMVGVDPAPRKMPYLLRILLLLLTMAMHAFFGVGLMSLSEPVGMQWYGAFEVPWLDSVLEDQQAGGGIAWGMGEVPTLLVLLALLRQWWHDEERIERRRERHSRRGGSDDADLDAYNAYLERLDRQAKKHGSG